MSTLMISTGISALPLPSVNTVSPRCSSPAISTILSPATSISSPRPRDKRVGGMEEVDNKEKIVEVASGEEGADDEDDCYEIDPIDFARKLTIDDSDDIVIVAEKGPVALKDFPHPRHLCGNFPFHSTSHESHCDKCFCYVCETPAPCRQWRGTDGHCHVSKKHEEFQELGEPVKAHPSHVKEEGS